MSQRICAVPECNKPLRARGLCSTHYNNEHQPNRHDKVEIPCAYCGTPVMKHATTRRKSFCGLDCQNGYGRENKTGAWSRVAKPKPEPKPRDSRSLLRRAMEDSDAQALIEAVRARCDVRTDGCWEWQGTLHRTGYAVVSMADATYQVHRLVLEARLGKPLGKQAAHHICATASCVNPDHLQPVTAAANAAEMLARRYMESRISDLETALRLVQPDHPLLAEVGVC